MKGLTERQQQVLEYVTSFISEKHYSPSLSEIAMHLQLQSVSTVFKHIKALCKKGHLNLEPNSKRSLFPTLSAPLPQKGEFASLPLVAKLTIGDRLETFSKTENFPVPSWMFSSSIDNTYLVRNEIDSDEEYLQKGDLLIVEGRNEPMEGERILALFHHHDPIIKTFRRKEGYISLESLHFGTYPLIVREDDIAIQGIILGLLRTSNSKLG